MILRRLARTSQVLAPRIAEALADFQPTWCLRPARGRCLTHRSTRTLQPRALSSRLRSDFLSPFIVRLAAPPVNSIR